MVRKIKKQKAKWTRKTVSWWVSELLVADCLKARLRPEWADTMQEWYNWLHEETQDEKKRREKQRKKLVPRMISGGGKRTRFLG